jgi:ribosomal protein S18 acetylase RimI-like enzyme
MIISMRAYAGEEDRQRMIDLAARLSGRTLPRADQAFRLASWALDTPENVRLWVDQRGALIGYAVLQTPWQTLDLVAGAHAALIDPPAIVWAVERARAIAAAQEQPVPLFVDVREEAVERAALLRRAGFAARGASVLYLSRRLDDLIPVPQLPLGFALRPLAGPGEVAEYVRVHRAAFDSHMMTIAWRRRTLELAEYIPELDIVAVAPDGRIAAFCLCWLSPARRVGQIDPIGVDPQFHRLGLAAAVLFDGLWRLQAHGAEIAQVAVYSDDQPACALFAAAGFRISERATTYAREFEADDDTATG